MSQQGVHACLVACWKPCSNGRDGGGGREGRGGDSAFEKSDSDVLPSPPPFFFSCPTPFLCVWDGAGRGKKVSEIYLPRRSGPDFFSDWPHSWGRVGEGATQEEREEGRVIF